MSNFNLYKELDSYYNASSRIFKHFGCEITWLEICDHTDCYWDENDVTVNWTPRDEFEETHDEFVFSSVIHRSEIHVKDNHVMIVADPQLGDGPQALIFTRDFQKKGLLE